jgi:hypothetical protein
VQVLDHYVGRRVPTVDQPVVVTKPGGTVTIGQFQVVGREQDFPPFQTGEEYILFLEYDPVTSRFEVPSARKGHSAISAERCHKFQRRERGTTASPCPCRHLLSN